MQLFINQKKQHAQTIDCFKVNVQNDYSGIY
jgi:hypothetical protein